MSGEQPGEEVLHRSFWIAGQVRDEIPDRLLVERAAGAQPRLWQNKTRGGFGACELSRNFGVGNNRGIRRTRIRVLARGIDPPERPAVERAGHELQSRSDSRYQPPIPTRADHSDGWLREPTSEKCRCHADLRCCGG